jgi:hypothetical protein
VFSAAAATRPSRPRIFVSLGVSLCVENNKQREKRGGILCFDLKVGFH